MSLSSAPFRVYYTSEVASIICGHHVYMEVWHTTEGEVLEAAPDIRNEV